MSLRRSVVFLVILLLTFVHFSQGARTSTVQQVAVVIDAEREGEGLPYTGVPIAWDDFKAAPDAHSRFSAMIYSGIALKYEYVKRNEGNVMLVKVRPYMNHTKSWYKEALANEELLQHEQGHFDIAALVAKELANAISSRYFEVASFKSEVDSIYRQYQDILAKRQTEYDHATHHGVEKDAQIVWSEQLSQQLGTVAMH